MLKAVTFLGAAALAAALSAPARAEGPTGSTVMATVNGTDITLGQMIAMRDSLPAQYKDLPDDVLFKGVLDQMIQQVALSQIANKEVSERDKIEMENQRRSYLASALLNRTANAAVTDEALKKAFDEKYAAAAPTKEFSAAHILVATEDEAKAIKTDLDKGGDFAEIAKTKSTDQGSAQNGGDLGWFGPGMMVEPFEKAVMGMEPGTVSDPVQTQFGWHIIKLNETRLAKGPTLDEKRDELTTEIQRKTIEDYITSVTAKSEVKKMTDGVDPAILKNLALLGD